MSADTSLVTGFPAFTAQRLMRRLVEKHSDEKIYLLVRDKFISSAEAFIDTLGAARTRVQILEGDVADMDLGLGGGEYKALADEVTAIHHTAAVYYLGAKRELVERVNIDGT